MGASVSGSRAGIGYYNSRRPHSSLDAPSPDQAYFQPANARGGSGVTEAENHLENARILLKSNEPSLFDYLRWLAKCLHL